MVIAGLGAFGFRVRGALVLPADDRVAYRWLQRVGRLDAADGKQAAGHGAIAPDRGVVGKPLLIRVVQIGCGVDEPVLSGIGGAHVELVSQMNFVLIGRAIVEIIEHAWHARPGMSGDDDDVLGRGAWQRVRAIIGSVGTGLIHGVWIDSAIDHAAGTILKLRVYLDRRDE